MLGLVLASGIIFDAIEILLNNRSKRERPAQLLPAALIAPKKVSPI